MAGCGVRSIYEGVVDEFVVLADSVAEASLFDLFSVSHLVSFLTSSWLDVGE